MILPLKHFIYGFIWSIVLVLVAIPLSSIIESNKDLLMGGYFICGIIVYIYVSEKFLIDKDHGRKRQN